MRKQQQTKNNNKRVRSQSLTHDEEVRKMIETQVQRALEEQLKSVMQALIGPAENSQDRYVQRERDIATYSSSYNETQLLNLFLKGAIGALSKKF